MTDLLTATNCESKEICSREVEVPEHSRKISVYLSEPLDEGSLDESFIEMRRQKDCEEVKFRRYLTYRN